jgi:hypothetical protein
MSGQNDLICDMHAEQAVQANQINSIEKGVDDIRTCLLGNGKPGLVVRMDRVEQREGIRSRIFWILFALISTGLVGLFFSA